MPTPREAAETARSILWTYPGVAVAAALAALATGVFEVFPRLRVVAAPVGFAGALTTVLLLTDHALVRFVNDVFFQRDGRLGDAGESALRGFTSVASAALFVALGTAFQSVVTVAGLLAAVLYALVGRHGDESPSWVVLTVFALPLCLLVLVRMLQLTVAATFTPVQYAALALLGVLAALLAGCWERYGRSE